MEYYAKSKQRYLDREERNELIAVLLRIKEELGAELTETENTKGASGRDCKVCREIF